MYIHICMYDLMFQTQVGAMGDGARPETSLRGGVSETGLPVAGEGTWVCIRI